MIFSDIEEFTKSLGTRKRLLGVDLGDKRIGLAISDPSGFIASPLETLYRTKWAEDSAHLFKLMDEREIGGLVIGWPLNMDGSEGPRCQSTRQTANNILKVRDIPILLWDERLSSWEAEQRLIDAHIRRKKHKEKIDQIAATIILQSALDRLRK